MAKEKKVYTKTITLPNGKRKYIRSADPKELDRKYNELKAEIGAGVDVSSDVTVLQLAQTWYTVYKKPHLKEGGQRAVKNTVNNHILPIIGALKVRDVKPVHIRQVMAAESDLSKSQQRKTIQALRGIFRAGVENGIIVKSPVPEEMKASGKDTEEKVPLTTLQSQRLLQTVKDTRAFLCVAIILGTGLRREEVCGLMWSDIDLAEGSISVNRVRTFYDNAGSFSDDLKSKAARRTVPTPNWLTEALRAAHANAKSLYVLHTKTGAPLTKDSFRSMWEIITSRTTDDSSLLGKPIDERHPKITYGIDFHVYPHLLRHTCITRWFEAGLDVKTVQYLAGHETPEITLKIYTHYLQEEREAVTMKKIKESDVLAAVGQ